MATPKLKYIPLPNVVAAQEAKDKELIEQMKKSISHKLKDPELAKKAAQIIAELLEENEKQKQKSSLKK
jgi:hypothetical protein